MSRINLQYLNYDPAKWLEEYVLTASAAETIPLEAEEFYEYKALYASSAHDVGEDNWCRACEYAEWLLKFTEFSHIISDSASRESLEYHFNKRWCVSKEKAKIIVNSLSTSFNLTLND